MAKALAGHFGPDARLVSEVTRLRARVRELEAELVELRAREVIDIASNARDDSLRAPIDALQIERATPALT